LDFLDLYDGLKYAHLEKFFPNSRKIVNYLLKNNRVYMTQGDTFISTDPNFSRDKTLIAALNVLGDIYEKVRSHARATSPAQLSFFTHNGDYYEIIYVGYGLDAMIMASFEVQRTLVEQALEHGDLGINLGRHPDAVKRMVIVEDKNQMSRLKIPNITRFALVEPDGSLTYFKGNGG